jgi:hypothetical protein
LGGFLGESFVESSQLFLVEAHLPKRETDVIHTITLTHLIHLRFLESLKAICSDVLHQMEIEVFGWLGQFPRLSGTKSLIKC